jgi:hypothetical protein
MKLPSNSTYVVGDKLYELGPGYRDRPPKHVVAVLTDAAADPWPWLLVVRQWWPHKQRWSHELLNPIEVKIDGHNIARHYPTREEVIAVMEQGR